MISGTLANLATSAVGALTSKEGMAGIGTLGLNMLGGASNSATGYYMAKKMAQYNYDLQKKGYREFPTAQVEGLRAAGINPMVAYGGIAGAQAHAQNYTPGSNSTLGSDTISSALKAKERGQQDKVIGLQAKQLDLQNKQLESTIDLNSSAAEKNRQDKVNSVLLTQAQSDKLRSEVDYNRYQPVSVNELTGGEASFLKFSVGGKTQHVRTVNFDKKTGMYYYPNTTIPVVFDAPHSAVGVAKPEVNLAQPPAFIISNQNKYGDNKKSIKAKTKYSKSLNVSDDVADFLNMKKRNYKNIVK